MPSASIGWGWIIVQGLAGGSSEGDVASLFLWVYGWVGLAIVSALVGPAWHFLDPFSTLHDLGAAVLARLGVQGWAPADYPVRLGRWPAVIGFAGFVWLELVYAAGPSTLFVVLVGYTAFTIAMMGQFGRDEWRSQGETFTRLVPPPRPAAPTGDSSTRTARSRPGRSAAGCWSPARSAADVTLVALGVSSIIFDGLSQTQAFFDLFGAPGLVGKTGLLIAFLGIVVLLAFGVVADGRARRSAPACCRSRSAT